MALAVAQGDPAAQRAVVVTLADGPDRATRLAALGAAVAEDGGRFLSERVARADPLGAVRALARKVARGSRATDGAAALARHAARALETGDAWSVLVLDAADEAAPEAARWWWSLARRVAGAESLAPVLLMAIVKPPRTAEPMSAWRMIEGTLRGAIRVARLSAPIETRERAASRKRETRVRRGSFASIRHVLAGRAGTPGETRLARLALLGAALAALRGDVHAVQEMADAAAAAAIVGDDLREDAAAELAAALAALVAEATDAGLRIADAEAAAMIADDATLIAGARLARACVRQSRGDDQAAREELAGVHEERLAVPFRTLVSWLREEGDTPPGGARVAAWALLRDAARDVAPGNDARRERARGLLEATGARATLRAIELAGAAGLGSAGRADAAGMLGAAAAIAGASTTPATAAAALDAALSLVPARGGSATLTGDSRAAVRRGASLLGLPAGARMQAPMRAEGGGETAGVLVLERATGDPSFSREERRVVEAVAAVAAARLLAIAGDTAPEAEPPPEEAEVGEAALGGAEREVLERALAAHANNLSRTARSLGLSRNGLKMKMSRHGLRGHDHRG